MTTQSQFTPEQIAALVAGDPVSFSKTSKTDKTVSKDVQSHPVAAEPIAFTPATSVSIAKVSKVTAPNVKDKQGKVISEAGTVITPNFSEDSDLAKRERLRLEQEQAEKDARVELAKATDPTHLLNQLNGLRRIVEKQSKEIAALKKESK